MKDHSIQVIVEILHLVCHCPVNLFPCHRAPRYYKVLRTVPVTAPICFPDSNPACHHKRALDEMRRQEYSKTKKGGHCDC